MSQYGRDQLAESGCREREGLQQERWGGMKEDRERATGGGGKGGVTGGGLRQQPRRL